MYIYFDSVYLMAIKSHQPINIQGEIEGENKDKKKDRKSDIHLCFYGLYLSVE